MRIEIIIIMFYQTQLYSLLLPIIMLLSSGKIASERMAFHILFKIYILLTHTDQFSIRFDPYAKHN